MMIGKSGGHERGAEILYYVGEIILCSIVLNKKNQGTTTDARLC
jgi:hypothetical protein